ncbi:MAG: phosphatase PAP2 family protein [Xanthomonadaceae bacterium]|nr:phosphatase PAP2 family protein [Xanthomonadaceae bacterium]
MKILFILTLLATAQEKPKLHYLTSEDLITIEDGLVSPANGSIEDLKDDMKIDEIIKKRTPKQCAQATREMNQTFESFFGDMITPADLLKLKPLITKIEDDFGISIYRVKMKAERVRPIDRKPDLKLCPDHKRKEGGYPKDSFPSGHAGSGYLEALFLSDLYLSKAKEFLERGEQIGWNRVAIGVHHPSDVIAGQLMAKRAYKRFKAHGKFRKAFQAVKKSIH